jgi:hypothetical protein
VNPIVSCTVDVVRGSTLQSPFGSNDPAQTGFPEIDRVAIGREVGVALPDTFTLQIQGPNVIVPEPVTGPEGVNVCA